MTPPDSNSNDGMPTGLGDPLPEDGEHHDRVPVNPPGLVAPLNSAGLASDGLASDGGQAQGADALVELNALLGRGTRYTGKLYFEGRMRIEGTFTGEILGDDVLVIGEGAEIEADIEVGVCIVTGGRVRGNLRARDAIELHAPAVVDGDLHAPNIFIDRGAQFEGNCKMAPLDETNRPPEATAEQSTSAEPPSPRDEAPQDEAPQDEAPQERGPRDTDPMEQD